MSVDMIKYPERNAYEIQGDLKTNGIGPASTEPQLRQPGWEKRVHLSQHLFVRWRTTCFGERESCGSNIRVVLVVQKVRYGGSAQMDRFISGVMNLPS